LIDWTATRAALQLAVRELRRRRNNLQRHGAATNTEYLAELAGAVAILEALVTWIEAARYS
jgi:hypothetical protein